LKLEPFDTDYVRRLTEGDPAIGDHFASYFGCILDLWLRSRVRSIDLHGDIVQGTLLRVLMILREGDGVRCPERFGAFVLEVCRRVTWEMSRAAGRYEQWDETLDEPFDVSVDLDAGLVNTDRQEAIAEVFEKIPARDREILQAIYLEETPKVVVCRKFEVDDGYLRVLLHRAREHFRKAADGDGGFPFKPK